MRMPSTRKRKSISSASANTGGNTLLSYFAAGSSAESPSSTQAQGGGWKKAKIERSPSVSPSSGKENKGLLGVANGLACGSRGGEKGKGTREEPIEIPADDEEEEEEVVRVVEEVLEVKEEVLEVDMTLDDALLDDPLPEASSIPDQSVVAEQAPPDECTPPPPPAALDTIPEAGLDGPSFSLEHAPEMDFGDAEWEMGDDEIVPGAEGGEGTEYGDDVEDLPDLEGAIREAEDDEPEAGEKGAEANEAGCPVCGKIIEDLEKLQLHVNACLDSPPSPAPPPPPAPSTSTPKPPPKRKPSLTPLKPLSGTPNFSLPSPSTSAPAPSTAPPPSNPSAFSVLMSQNKDSLAWAAAEQDDSRGPRAPGSGRRKAPFYKVLQGMPIAVDAFRYGKIPGVTAYCLTHAHSDHYTNLSSSWKHGPIYCSQTTANLIKLNLSVPSEYVRPLPLNVPTILPDTGGVQVTLLEANHCPGSVLFLFLGKQTCNAGDSPVPSPFVGSKRVFRYLHCGDFRACPKHALHPEVLGKKLDIVYLDTTYLNPKYCFPPQPQVIEACASLARRVVLGVKKEDGDGEEGKGGRGLGLGLGGSMQAMIQGWFRPKLEDVDEGKLEEAEKMEEEELVKAEPVDPSFEGSVPTPLPPPPPAPAESSGAASGTEQPKQKPKTLVAIGTYSIGKERIVKAIALALNSKIYCDARKRSLLMAQDDPELHSLLTSDPYTCQVHLLPLQNITIERMGDYLAHFKGLFDRVLGFRPTGWTYVPPAGTDTMPDVSRVITRDQKRTFDLTQLKPMRGANAKYMLYGVPYSEHSSFFELTCFALSVDWAKMIATVNVGSRASRDKMGRWFGKWEVERRRRRERGEGVVRFRSEEYW